jgi:hypothetical protein
VIFTVPQIVVKWKALLLRILEVLASFIAADAGCLAIQIENTATFLGLLLRILSWYLK